jgi:hypothetical protein
MSRGSRGAEAPLLHPIKGASRGLKVFRQYATSPMIVSYVLDPLGDADVVLLTGELAWNLPTDYATRGGKASDHDAGNAHYNWPARTRLLTSILNDYRATPERWLTLFCQTATPAHTDSSAVTPA